jgi:hypothetical protein
MIIAWGFEPLGSNGGIQERGKNRTWRSPKIVLVHDNKLIREAILSTIKKFMFSLFFIYFFVCPYIRDE